MAAYVIALAAAEIYSPASAAIAALIMAMLPLALFIVSLT